MSTDEKIQKARADVAQWERKLLNNPGSPYLYRMLSDSKQKLNKLLSSGMKQLKVKQGVQTNLFT